VLAAAAAACGGSQPAPPAIGGAAPEVARDPLPRELTVATAVVWRQRAAGSLAWGRAEITNVFGFHRAPAVGDRTTVLPLDGGPPLDLAVTRTTKRDEIAEVAVWWEVDLEPTTAPWILTAQPQAGRAEEYPFDAIVIHPAVPGAHLVAPSAQRELPPGASLQTVTAAIDLDDDATADAFVCSYCCGDPSKPGSSCEYVCGTTYRRLDGAWLTIDESMPL
jgi:hypothetical protein